MPSEEKKQIKLPEYAKLAPSVKGKNDMVNVQAELMYQYYLAAYGVEKVDQYWLEVCYQSMKMDLQLAMGTFAFVIHIHDKDKKFAQSKWPPGKGSAAATKGREARMHFQKLRGALPK